MAGSFVDESWRPGILLVREEDGHITGMNAAAGDLLMDEPRGAEGVEAAELDVPLGERSWNELLRRAARADPGREPDVVVSVEAEEERLLRLSFERLELEAGEHLLCMVVPVAPRPPTLPGIPVREAKDALTGFLNRFLWEARLARCLERTRVTQGQVAVIVLDLNRFRVVNESFGHSVGDLLLAEVADRVRGCVRDADALGRVGGDEFAVFLPDVADREDAERVAARIQAALEPPLAAAETPVHLGASMGIALGSAEEGGPSALLRNAEMAMARAKRAAGAAGETRSTESPYRVYDPGRDSVPTDRLQRENELRRALEEGELLLEYQPIVSLETGEVMGAEALVRWEHPERGRLPPAEFIPLAERSGLVLPLGRWVLERATREAAAWPANGRSVPVTVNVSPRTLRDRRLADHIDGALSEAGLEPGRLILEITENAAVEGMGALSEIRGRGIRILVDDLGKGYAALEYFKRIDVDGFKVDRSFVAGLEEDIRDRAIVEATVLLGRRLSMQVVAEGIESPAQRERLRELGCALGQGFLFARPMPGERLAELLRDGGRIPPEG